MIVVTVERTFGNCDAAAVFLAEYIGRVDAIDILIIKSDAVQCRNDCSLPIEKLGQGGCNSVGVKVAANS